MSMSVDPLVLGRVIGDVIDPFVPTTSMSVYFGSKRVTNSCDIKPSIATLMPHVSINGDPHQLYTLVMTDPDAPTPSEPTLREFVHWIVTDIPGTTSPDHGNEVLSYLGPRPPIGIHRYVIILFQQRSRIGLLAPPLSRTHFNTRAFAIRFGLGMPVATVYFNAKKEPRRSSVKQAEGVDGDVDS